MLIYQRTKRGHWTTTLLADALHGDTVRGHLHEEKPRIVTPNRSSFAEIPCVSLRLFPTTDVRMEQLAVPPQLNVAKNHTKTHNEKRHNDQTTTSRQVAVGAMRNGERETNTTTTINVENVTTTMMLRSKS